MVDRRNRLAALAVLALLAIGCERASDASSSPGSVTGASAPGPTDVVVPDGFDRTAAALQPAGAEAVDVVDLDVWFAGDQGERHQGLTAVTDLGGADGMLFVFDAPAEYRFYMWQTPLPLDIFFFGADGHFIGSEAMEPCLDDSSTRCERFSPGAPFLLALEVPQGSLDALTIDETWTISFEPPVPESSGPSASAPLTTSTDR